MKANNRRFTKGQRQMVFDKYKGHCAYCGKNMTIKEMQIDHMIPRWTLANHTYFNVTLDSIECYDNYMPSCRRCNHYKRGDTLEQYRNKMNTLHERIEKEYINKVGIDFGIITLKPFDGLFYFEKNK
jgi:5-methylcytosine-specific restriction endonuclease McrA